MHVTLPPRELRYNIRCYNIRNTELYWNAANIHYKVRVSNLPYFIATLIRVNADAFKIWLYSIIISLLISLCSTNSILNTKFQGNFILLYSWILAYLLLSKYIYPNRLSFSFQHFPNIMFCIGFPNTHNKSNCHYSFRRSSQV